MRQCVLCHAIARQIENGIEQCAAAVLGFRSPRVTSRRQQGFKLRPLLIGQVTGVGLVVFHTTLYHNSSLKQSASSITAAVREVE